MKTLRQLHSRITDRLDRFELWIDSVDEARFFRRCDAVMRGVAYFGVAYIVLTAIRALLSGAFDLEVR